MKSRNSRFAAFLLILVFAFLFPSCITSPDQGDSAEGTEKSDESGEEQKTLVIGMPRIQLDLDPLHAFTANEFQIYAALTEGLVSYHPLTLQPLPAVARRWDITPDRKTYRFTLRDDAYYKNGDPVKAGDFRNAWLRLIDTANKAEYSVFFDIISGVAEYKATGNKDLIGIRAVSDKILEVDLVKPADHFLKILCHMSFIPIHPDYTGKSGWGKSKNLITNGPYYILDWTENELVLAKNNLYWDADFVEIQKIRILFSKDITKITGDFNLEKIHWATDFDYDLLQDKDTVIVHPMFSTSYFFFTCGDAPWNDFRLRRGLSLLLPWPEIRKEEYRYPTETLVPAFPDYPKPDGIREQRQEEALYLLKEAGFENGKGLPAILLKVPENSDEFEIAQLMAKTWKDSLGAEVKIQTYPYGTYFDELKKGGYTLGVMTWIGDFIDPLTFLQMWQSGSNLNDAKFSDTEYDGLIDGSYSEEGEVRYAKLSKAEGILLGKAVVLPIRNYIAFNAVNTRVIEGWYPNLLDMHPFKYLRFKKERVFPNVVMLD
jgi:oligopeptide transport system substrate-binding protein